MASTGRHQRINPSLLFSNYLHLKEIKMQIKKTKVHNFPKFPEIQKFEKIKNLSGHFPLGNHGFPMIYNVYDYSIWFRLDRF